MIIIPPIIFIPSPHGGGGGPALPAGTTKLSKAFRKAAIGLGGAAFASAIGGVGGLITGIGVDVFKNFKAAAPIMDWSLVGFTASLPTMLLAGASAIAGIEIERRKALREKIAAGETAPPAPSTALAKSFYAAATGFGALAYTSGLTGMTLFPVGMAVDNLHGYYAADPILNFGLLSIMAALPATFLAGAAALAGSYANHRAQAKISDKAPKP